MCSIKMYGVRTMIDVYSEHAAFIIGKNNRAPSNGGANISTKYTFF